MAPTMAVASRVHSCRVLALVCTPDDAAGFAELRREIKSHVDERELSATRVQSAMRGRRARQEASRNDFRGEGFGMPAAGAGLASVPEGAPATAAYMVTPREHHVVFSDETDPLLFVSSPCAPSSPQISPCDPPSMTVC